MLLERGREEPIQLQFLENATAQPGAAKLTGLAHAQRRKQHFADVFGRRRSREWPFSSSTSIERCHCSSCVVFNSPRLSTHR